jgi:hypothetical protein
VCRGLKNLKNENNIYKGFLLSKLKSIKYQLKLKRVKESVNKNINYLLFPYYYNIHLNLGPFSNINRK